MPYVPREGTVQATDIVDTGLADVYYSPSVYVNNVPVALWQSPVSGNSVLSLLNLPAAPPVADYAPNPEQIANYKAAKQASQANPESFYIAEGANAGTFGNLTAPMPPGANTTDPNDLSGNPANMPNVPLANGDSILGKLENYLNQCLQQAKTGGWKEQGGCPGNPNIMHCFNQCGYPPDKLARIGQCDDVAWCAAFAGTALQAAGALSLSSLTAKSYSDVWFSRGAQRVPLMDPSQWRRNDVVYKESVFNGKLQGHVAFLRGVDLSTGHVALIGGNQGNDVCVGTYTSLHDIRTVGRAWPVTAEFDKPILGPVPYGKYDPGTR